MPAIIAPRHRLQLGFGESASGGGTRVAGTAAPAADRRAAFVAVAAQERRRRVGDALRLQAAEVVEQPGFQGRIAGDGGLRAPAEQPMC